MEPVTHEEMITILKEITERVEIGDSYEGFLNYLMPEPDAPPEIKFQVEARFRVGNLDGQGGMKIIGVDTEPVPELDHVRVISDLTAQVNRLSREKTLAETERTESAKYAVRAEDEAGLLREERRWLIRCVKHLYKHLQADDRNEPITTPGDECTAIHPKLKEYLQ